MLRLPIVYFFDAIAFYALGNYLNDEKAMETGRFFAQKALKQRNVKAGYFIEKGGWDSSYNGVAIMLGFELYCLLPKNDPLKERLGKTVSCATYWQKSRVLKTGEISTQGNTRVYPGGEYFFGNEKQVDVKKTVRAFYYMSILSNKQEYKELAERIYKFYYQFRR